MPFDYKHLFLPETHVVLVVLMCSFLDNAVKPKCDLKLHSSLHLII